MTVMSRGFKSHSAHSSFFCYLVSRVYYSRSKLENIVHATIELLRNILIKPQQ